jgi:hypothetical protein
MCSYQQWESLGRRFHEAVDEDQVREFVADAAARVEALVEELMSRARDPENADWGCGGRHHRSRTEWVA